MGAGGLLVASEETFQHDKEGGGTSMADGLDDERCSKSRIEDGFDEGAMCDVLLG